jgi:hypothetical protein
MLGWTACAVIENRRCVMARYYVNKNAQPSGDHEVHKEGCSFMPAAENRLYLGDFSSCHPAVREAEKYYTSADGCYFCCKDCNKG